MSCIISLIDSVGVCIRHVRALRCYYAVAGKVLRKQKGLPVWDNCSWKVPSTSTTALFLVGGWCLSTSILQPFSTLLIRGGNRLQFPTLNYFKEQYSLLLRLWNTGKTGDIYWLNNKQLIFFHKVHSRTFQQAENTTNAW